MSVFLLECRISDNYVFLEYNSFVSLFTKVFMNGAPTSIEFVPQKKYANSYKFYHRITSYNAEKELPFCQNVKEEWKNCIFPIFVSDKTNMIHGGLCSSLRALILNESKMQPLSKAHELLVRIFCRYTMSKNCSGFYKC